MNCKKLICDEGLTIKEVMTCINNNAKGTVFVINENEEIVGLITDGDIRRALLNGAGLKEPIKTYMNSNFMYAFNYVDAQKIFQQYGWKIRIIPLVDESMHIVDYIEYDDKQHISLAQPQLNGNEYNYLMDAFLSTWISSTGKYVTQFEEMFSRYCGVRYGIATSNGTTALHLALTALGIGVGDEVIVPDITFAATINAVIYTGATPVIVDIEEDSWCIDPDAIESVISPNVKAIIPVHIYGQPCNMDRICDIAKKNNLYIIEDCAEAHGAEWNGQKVGSFGIISCFSFFGNKVITTGEGGMCVTNSEKLNETMRILRDHGMNKKRKYYHDVVGFNYRMTNLQAAIGTAQTERIEEILQWHTELEEKYRMILSEVDGIMLQRNDLINRKKITWLVSVLVNEKKRDEILKKLKNNNIDARAFFIPLSEMTIYKKYAHYCDKSRRISRMGLNLPTTYEIDEGKIQRIAGLIVSVL